MNNQERDSLIENTRNNIFSEIAGVSKERQGNYGSAYDSFNRIGTMFSAYFKAKYSVEIAVSPSDVAYLMSLFKMCREFHKYSKDNGVDGTNYAAFGYAFDAYEEAQKNYMPVNNTHILTGRITADRLDIYSDTTLTDLSLRDELENAKKVQK